MPTQTPVPATSVPATSVPATHTSQGSHGLEGLDLPAAHELYQGRLGVLYVDVPGKDAERLWRELRGRWDKSGYYPVILGGAGSTVSPVLKWVEEEPAQSLQQGTHSVDSPGVILSEAATVDVAALLAPGGNPSYQGWKLDSGAWPAQPKPSRVEAYRDPVEGTPYPQVRIALVPVDAAWKSLAYLTWFLGAGEATPSMAQAVAVCRTWEEKYWATIIAVSPASIEWSVAKPMQSHESALAFAEEHFSFTPDAGPRIKEERAAWLLGARYWYSWWD